MLTSVVVKAPPIKDRLEFMRKAVEKGWYTDAQKVGERVVEFLRRNTPRSKGRGSQDGVHIADGWELHTIGGKEKSGRGFLMVVFNRFTTTPAGKILPKARMNKVDSVSGGTTKADYTLMHILEYGSRPHRIFPFRKKVLRFMSPGGGVIFTSQVNHPGTAPTGMIRLARAYAVGWYKEFLNKWSGKLKLK
jgi:hypothetical protein